MEADKPVAMKGAPRREVAEPDFKSLREELEEKILAELPAELVQGRFMQVKVEKLDESLEKNSEGAKRIIEGLLFSTPKPLTVSEIRKVLRSLKPSEIEKIVGELAGEYAREARSFRVLEIAGGYEISTDPKYAPWIMRLETEKRKRQASQSALVTLSILAYKQPVTRMEIEDLRGVDVGSVLTTLLERGLIRIVGRKEVPGRPFLYGTTPKFLEHFGLKTLSDLPQLSEIREFVEKSVPREKLIDDEKKDTAPPTAESGNPPEENRSSG
jgi:segregation and condensation protein B